jgi:hypothetical protein
MNRCCDMILRFCGIMSAVETSTFYKPARYINIPVFKSRSLIYCFMALLAKDDRPPRHLDLPPFPSSCDCAVREILPSLTVVEESSQK